MQMMSKNPCYWPRSLVLHQHDYINICGQRVYDVDYNTNQKYYMRTKKECEFNGLVKLAGQSVAWMESN